MPSIQSHIFRLWLKRQKGRWSPGTPVETQRAGFEAAAKMAKMPPGVQVKLEIQPGFQAEWLEPDQAADDRVILYFHGGGYCLGSCRTHRALAARIATASQARVLLLDYRLAPEYPFPAAVEDAITAFRWLLDSGLASEQITLAGDSAGGNLALATLLALRDGGDVLPAAAVCLSPLTDMTGSGETATTRAAVDPYLTPDNIALLDYYCGERERTLPLLSPLFGDLRGLPPLLIQVGNDEVLLSDSTRLAERAQAAGVEVTLSVWPGMWHVFQFFAPYLPEANEAIEAIGAFIRQQVSLTTPQPVLEPLP